MPGKLNYQVKKCEQKTRGSTPSMTTVARCHTVLHHV